MIMKVFLKKNNLFFQQLEEGLSPLHLQQTPSINYFYRFLARINKKNFISTNNWILDKLYQ